MPKKDVENKFFNLILEINEYLTEHPRALLELPKKSIVIPFDEKDSQLWEFSKKSMKEAAAKEKRAIIAAYKGRKGGWRFEKVLYV